MARRHAAAALRSGEAATAELRMVTVVTGVADLRRRYVPVSGTRLEGRRHGAGIRWRALRHPAAVSGL